VLDNDKRLELFSFAPAISIDSVVLLFRPIQAETLRQLATLMVTNDGGMALGDVLSEVTCGGAAPEANDNENK